MSGSVNETLGLGISGCCPREALPFSGAPRQSPTRLGIFPALKPVGLCQLGTRDPAPAGEQAAQPERWRGAGLCILINKEIAFNENQQSRGCRFSTPAGLNSTASHPGRTAAGLWAVEREGRRPGRGDARGRRDRSVPALHAIRELALQPCCPQPRAPDATVPTGAPCPCRQCPLSLPGAA